jgi:ABC-type multidrug transport system ATPase subunit
VSDVLLALDSFGKSFRGRTVLHAASLWGTVGRITVLLGRNGCGKSTLLRAGIGLIGADHGQTRWEGEPLRRPALADLAQRGLMFIPDHGLLSRRLPLRPQLELYAEAFGGSVDEAARAEGIDHLLDQRAGQISGGEERRGELALARLRRPRCLVADEPFAGLSPIDRVRVSTDLRDHAARGAAVMVTGHEVEDLLAIADEVIWMVAGTTHVLGSPDAAREHHQFRREYLGPARGVA